MNSILVVEDDKLFRYALKECLDDDDNLIVEASTGARCLQILNSYEVQLIVLDLVLSDVQGVDLIPDIRARSEAPIVVLSGVQEGCEKISALESGADDFIEKPFDMKEIRARINAHLRREKRHCDLSERESEDDDQRIPLSARWTLCRRSCQVEDAGGTSAGLTYPEYTLLDYMVANAGKVISREELRNSLREQNYVPTPRAIDIKVARIRRKLDDQGTDNQIIRTARGLGYMLALPEVPEGFRV